MRKIAAALLLLALSSTTAFADEGKPELIFEKMAFKLVRGVTNVATSPLELPKQMISSVKELGGVGYAVGPLKGLGMTFYRALVGAAEVVLFPVPSPGYYDPMTDPEYVWHNWPDSDSGRRAQAQP